MAKGGHVTEDEEAAICEALNAGMSQNRVAKAFDRSPSTINRIASENGLEYSALKKAHEARQFYASNDRIRLVGEGLDKARNLLSEIDNPRDLKDWFLGVAIGIDKRRLEDEDVSGSVAGEITKLFDKMEADP